MKDILYISNQIKERILMYCTKDLLNFVLENFGHNHVIVERNERHPQAIWTLDYYLQEFPIDDRKNILAVILSFAAIGGIVRLGGKNYRGDLALLCALRKNRLITEDDEQYFIDAFWQFSHGENNRFALNI